MNQAANPTVAQIAHKLGCTEQQVRNQFAANAKTYTALADKAERTGKKVAGNTAEQWRAMAAKQLEGAAR